MRKEQKRRYKFVKISKNAANKKKYLLLFSKKLISNSKENIQKDRLT